jgi:hypothetical protein
MMNLIIFTLTVYGISNILVYGSIFEGFREALKRFGTGDMSIYKLFTCMMCLPTWIGFLISTIFHMYGMQTPISSIGCSSMGLSIFLDGVLASGAVYALNVLVEYFED